MSSSDQQLHLLVDILRDDVRLLLAEVKQLEQEKAALLVRLRAKELVIETLRKQ